MKKLKVTIFITLIFILSPITFVFAENQDATLTNTQTIIKQLQEQIKIMQAQIEDLKSQLTVVQTELKLTRTLRLGLTGDDVKQLQTFLKQFPDIYPEGLVTGYFGPLTETAVKKFQEKNDIESIGIVGPKTTAKLNELNNEGAIRLEVSQPGLPATLAPTIQSQPRVTTTISSTTTSTANTVTTLATSTLSTTTTTQATTTNQITTTIPSTSTTVSYTTPTPTPTTLTTTSTTPTTINATSTITTPPPPTPAPPPPALISSGPPIPELTGTFPNREITDTSSISAIIHPDSNGVIAKKAVFDFGDGTVVEIIPDDYRSQGYGVVASVQHTWSATGTYTVKVKVVDSTGLSSDWSAKSMTVSIRPSQPTLTASVSDSNVILNWTESSADVAGFNLYRQPGGWPMADISASVRTYTDPVSAGTYQYSLTAYNGAHFASNPSSPVTITVGTSALAPSKDNLANVLETLKFLNLLLQQLQQLMIR